MHKYGCPASVLSTLLLRPPTAPAAKLWISHSVNVSFFAVPLIAIWITWWCKHSFLCDLLSIHGCRHEWKYAAFLPFYVSGSWFPSHWSSALWGHSCIFYLCFDLILTSDRHLQSTPASTLDISTSFTLWTLVSNHINVCFSSDRMEMVLWFT